MLHKVHGAAVVHGDVIQVHRGYGQPCPGQQVASIPDLQIQQRSDVQVLLKAESMGSCRLGRSCWSQHHVQQVVSITDP